MFKRRFLILMLVLGMIILIIPATVTSQCEGPPEECPPGEEEPDYCEEFPERCEDEPGDDDGGDSGPPWDGYTDGRISPDPAEYYTIYCHEGTDTIYVVRVVPVTETIKEIPLIDAISLGIGQEQALGDGMLMERSSEEIITIYGSNGNLAPDAGSKWFNLNDCIDSNGGVPTQTDTSPPPDDDDEGTSPEQDEETDEERFRRRRQEAEESMDFCYSSYEFFGGDSNLLVDCLDFTLQSYSDVLTGDEILTLIIMVFCLNLMVGNGVLPIGIVMFLGWHRRWLRRQKRL